jgi:hypothetical protein
MEPITEVMSYQLPDLSIKLIISGKDDWVVVQTRKDGQGNALRCLNIEHALWVFDGCVQNVMEGRA